MTVIVQPGTDSNGNPQPMVYDSDTGKVIVDSNGFIVSGGQRLVNVPSKADYASTPKTQTSGIQEAINYIFYNGGGTVLFRKGLYDLSNAPFQTVPSLNGSTVPTILTIPGNSTDRTINISLIGEGYPSGAWEETSADASSGEVAIAWRNQTVTYTEYANLFYPSAITNTDFPNYMSNINLYINNIHWQVTQGTQAADTAMNAVVVEAVGRFSAGTIYLDQYPVFSTGGTPSGNGLVLGNGVQSVLSTIDTVYAESFYTGILIAGHYHINHVILQNCTIGFLVHPENTSSIYLMHIGEVTAQYVGTLINSTLGSIAMVINSIDYGDGTTSSDTLIDNTNTLYLVINGLNVAGPTSDGLSAPSLGTINDTTYVRIKGMSLITVTTPSVPASGTAQQNLNLTAVNVYIYGGDVTEIQITRNGTAYTVLSVSTAIAMSGQVYKLNPGDSITITYSTAPSWEWLAE